MNVRRIAWSIVGVLSLAAGAMALEPIAVLSPNDVPAGYGNGFGLSVAISGNYLVIGAPWDPWYNGLNTGAAYVFRRQGHAWIEQAKLTAPDTGWEDLLGYSVAIDGDVVVAGAPHYFPTYPDSSGPGAAYVFRRDDHGTPHDPTDDTWPQEAKLTAPNPQLGQLFGMSVAISGDVIVVGKPYSGYLGSAEVFRWNGSTWLYEASLIGSNTQGGDGFGSSVAVDASRIVIGAYWNDEGIGSAYVFAQKGPAWVEHDKLVAVDRAPGDFFGYSVSISCNSVAVGAPYKYNGTSFGVAYLFIRQGPGEWVEQSKIVSPDALRYDDFGYYIQIDRDLTITGMDPSQTAGRPLAWLFQREGRIWAGAGTLRGSAAFHSVAINGNYAVVATHVYAVRNQRTLRDFAAFQNCFAPCVGAELFVTCQPFDLAGDGRVDLSDFEVFIGTFVGP